MRMWYSGSRNRRSGFSGTGSLCTPEISIGATGRHLTAQPRRRIAESLADRLSMELRRSFLYLKQYWEEDVSQVLLCGDMPEIRVAYRAVDRAIEYRG
jgi:hypothetical protein